MEEPSVESMNGRSRELLSQLVDSKELEFEQTSKFLSEFKVLTREKTLSSQVLDEKCIELLCEYSKEYHTEAQMCLSNLILNYAYLRERVIEPYVKCATIHFTTILNHDIEFKRPSNSAKQSDDVLYYDLRILFLLSALCQEGRQQIRVHLLDPILRIIEKKADDYSRSNHFIVVESLKTLFNLTLGFSLNSPLAIQVIKSLFEIVGADRDIKDGEDGTKLGLTDQLLVNLIHLLTNMNEDVYLMLSNEDVDRILNHLDNQLTMHSKQRLKETVLPVLNVCANFCKYNDEVRKRWFVKVMSSEKSFDKRPEECDSLRGRLVKLMTSMDVHIKDRAAEFMHSICGGDTEKFITYTGFGNSAAFLSSRGLLGLNHSPGVRKDSNVVDDDYKDLSDKIDPITGRLQTPKKNPMEGLTDEEKEYHAHKLADAITKLTNLGVVKPLGINQEGKIGELCPNPLDENDN